MMMAVVLLMMVVTTKGHRPSDNYVTQLLTQDRYSPDVSMPGNTSDMSIYSIVAFYAAGTPTPC